MIDESGFEWVTVEERADDMVVVDRDGTEWTVPSPKALAAMRGAPDDSAPPPRSTD